MWLVIVMIFQGNVLIYNSAHTYHSEILCKADAYNNQLEYNSTMKPGQSALVTCIKATKGD